MGSGDGEGGCKMGCEGGWQQTGVWVRGARGVRDYSEV